MQLIERIVRRSDRRYSPSLRLASIFLEAAFFVICVPLLLAVSVPGPLADLRIRPVPLGIGAALALIGLAFALWTVWTQFTRANGTPVPIMPTQRLLTSGPYAYCRNPMALGTIVYYAGASIALWHAAPAVWTAMMALGLVIMIKTVEEREMFARFGAEYETYRASTPFILPRILKRSEKSAPRQR